MSHVTVSAISSSDDIVVNLSAFLRSLRAEHKSERTVETYAESVRQFDAYLLEHGMPTDIRAIRREHVESFIVELLEHWKPATANNRYRGLQAFFRWCADEELITDSPMAKMRPPAVPETPVPVLLLEDMQALIRRVEKGKSFDDRRDAVIIRIFYSTGLRLAELANLRYTPDNPDTNDVDLDQQVLRVIRGKGGRQPLVDMGAQSTRALDRYLMRPREQPNSHLPWLWISRKGRFAESGIGQIITRRGEGAGLKIHPHQLRHSWAHANQLHQGIRNHQREHRDGHRRDAAGAARRGRRPRLIVGTGVSSGRRSDCPPTRA